MNNWKTKHTLQVVVVALIAAAAATAHADPTLAPFMHASLPLLGALGAALGITSPQANAPLPPLAPELPEQRL